ncbi:MAG: hypothetical protein R3B57_13580 [Phycisphaerales bacterium]
MRRMGLLMIAVLLAVAARTHAQTDTAFTYQGELRKSGEPVNGTADLRFQLYITGGGSIGLPQTLTNVPVTDGRFSVELDFGATAFNLFLGVPRELAIEVRSPAGVGTYTALTPRQQVSRAPYSIQTRGLYADDNLNIGIGLSTPEAPLHVQEGSAGAVTAQADSSAVFERSSKNFVSLLSPSSYSRGFLFGDPSDIANGAIVFNDTQTPNGFQFRVGGNTTRMVIESDGTVGVGTIAPLSNARMTVTGNVGESAVHALSSHASVPTLVASNLDQGYALQIEGLGHVLGGTGGVMLVGSESGLNLGIDTNEIAARNNGQPSSLYLNYDGGNVYMGAARIKPALAYGTVSSSGALVSSSPNVQSVQHPDTGDYYISISGGFAAGDVFLVTPEVGFVGAGALLDSTSMYVSAWNSATDEKTNIRFSFVVYRP